MNTRFIPRGHKTAPFRARIRFGRLVFRQWEPRAKARGGSIILCVVFLFLTGSLYAENESSDGVLGEQWLGKITVKKTGVYSQGTVSITDGDIDQISSNDISQALSRSGSHLYVTSDVRGEHLFRLRGFD